VRAGADWGPVVPLDEAAGTLVELAARFQDRRGDGPTAPWHVHELDRPLTWPRDPDPALPPPTGPAAYGRHGGAEHVAVPSGVLGAARAAALADRGPELVVTPWHGVVVAPGGAR
jgi:precorrin-3B synthase